MLGNEFLLAEIYVLFASCNNLTYFAGFVVHPECLVGAIFCEATTSIPSGG